MNQIICMLQVIDAIYTVTPYASIQSEVHPCVGEELERDIKNQKNLHLTRYVLAFLERMRKVKPPHDANAIPEGTTNCEHNELKRECMRCNSVLEVYRLLFRQVVRTYATVISQTQTKLSAFKHIFALTPEQWLHVVGFKSMPEKGSSNLQHVPDEMSLLRQKRRHCDGRQKQADGGGSLRASMRAQSQMGSLTQDLTCMPRTLLGEALSDISNLSLAPVDDLSEEVTLESEDDFDRNEAMLALVKALFAIGNLPPEANTDPAALPDWMQKISERWISQEANTNVHSSNLTFYTQCDACTRCFPCARI